MSNEHDGGAGKPRRMLGYPIPIGPDCTAYVEIPRDLTKDEAGLICQLIRSLVIPKDEARKPTSGGGGT